MARAEGFISDRSDRSDPRGDCGCTPGRSTVNGRVLRGDEWESLMAADVHF